MESEIAYLINYLKHEKNIAPYYASLTCKYDDKRKLLRAMMNIWMPTTPLSPEFLRIQDTFLQHEAKQKNIVDANLLEATGTDPRVSLWQGDITRLSIDAIVNAANNKLLGCFIPNHSCIDNAIHSAAGLQLRKDCYQIMKAQGEDEETGKAKITPAYNLPSKYVLHTVGPIIDHPLNSTDCELLESCYRSCLDLANKHQLKSIAFCCISTGEFHFPNEAAAIIAVKCVKEFLKKESFIEKIVFNVFGPLDYNIYYELLQQH